MTHDPPRFPSGRRAGTRAVGGVSRLRRTDAQGRLWHLGQDGWFRIAPDAPLAAPFQAPCQAPCRTPVRRPVHVPGAPSSPGLPAAPAAAPDGCGIERAARLLGRRLSASEIAAVFGWRESDVTDALARLGRDA